MAVNGTIYYFSSTHWDREWCQSFQGFRNRLVTMMNELIGHLESDPDYKVFHLDGQTILLEDFLEIEPGRKERLAELIRQRRILIGPWYVMPDELLLSGESLIRNLLVGHQISKQWGVEPWKFGYVCDMFGHIAQMPQIFRGFGIDCALLGRGTNEHTHPAHFLWRSPDGSDCVTFKLNDVGGYGDFAWKVAYEMKEKNLTVDQTEHLVKGMIDYEMKRSPVPVTVVMDANDHQHVRKETPQFIEMISRLYPDAEVKHVNLAEMGARVRTFQDMLPVHAGEVYHTGRDKGPYNYVIRHTLSSRYPLKQANDQIQTLLERWVEPLAAIAGLQGFSVQQTYVDLAYKHLLHNHPHDSICGCSIDQVHKDMEYRNDQARLIGEQVVSDIMQFEQSREQTLRPMAANGHTRMLELWNPLAFSRKEVVTVDIDFHQDYPAKYAEPFGYEKMNSFLILGADGKEIPYAVSEIKNNWSVKIYNKTAAATVDRYRVSLEVTVPSMGKAVYAIVPFEASSRYLDRLSKSEREAENEFVKLRINDNGTLRVLDKQSGKTYDQLISYLDDGEIGDGWYHVNPAEDSLISSLGAPCMIERIENGPSRTVFRITHELKVPAAMNWDQRGIRRSSNSVNLTITSLVGLSRGAGYVDVETTINNRARDHRLRVKLPTRIEGEHYFVKQPFTMVERKTGIDLSTQQWKEYDVPEKQMGGIVGKRAEDGTGLVFISAYGLHECAVDNDEDDTITVTLYRSFRTTVMTNGEEGGQIIGELHFKYRLAFIQPDTNYADLVKQQDALQTQLRAASYKVSDEDRIVEHDSTPAPISYFQLDSRNICMSILKRPASGEKNAVVMRAYNLSDQTSDALLKSYYLITEVVEVNLNEEPIQPSEESIQPTDFAGHEVHLSLNGCQIKTYLIRF